MNKTNIATVIVTDIVGYSKLTGKNQELALELLAEHDKIILNYINHYDGKVLVNRGDGFVAMFENHSNAILCSVEIQVNIQKRNKFNVKNRKFNVRIGAHTGKYSKDKNDYYGECIDVASQLEPLAPSSGLLISEELNSLIEYDCNIYTREYSEYRFKKKKDKTYRVYLNLIDWYLDNRKKIKSIDDENVYNLKSHDLYHDCDYSGSIKFSNSVFENTMDDKCKFENLGFLCNSFIALGQLAYASKLLTSIKKIDYDKSDIELKAHFLKLESHILFNNKKYSKSNQLYENSYNLLIDIKSKYADEVLFYMLISLLLSNSLDVVSLKKIELINENKEYGLLVKCLELIVSDKINSEEELLRKLKNENNQQFKSYGFWILSKYYGQNNSIDKSYKYETIAQEMIKESSLSISDYTLRDDYLKKLIIHQKILSETSIQIDDLINVDDNNEDFFLVHDSINKNDIFNYCINCGEENLKNYIKCNNCNTNLLVSHYN